MRHDGAVPVRLGFEQHVEVVRAAGGRLAAQTAEVDLAAAVPTCPRWTVADLLAHQTTVHRWAAAHLSGGDPEAAPTERDLLPSVPDLRAHYAEGLALLLEALRTAPPDLEAMTFLRDAPAPREFWARRQAHETTVHAVDAQAAALGRAPTALEVASEGLTPEVALDGLDELVCGFVTRGRSKVVLDAPATVHVRPTDVDEEWTMVVADAITTTHGPTSQDDGDAVLSGTGTQLYLGLWNRGDEVVGRGRGREVLAAWRRGQRVRWS